MKIRNILSLLLAALLCVAPVFAETSEKVKQLTLQAVSPQQAEAVSAINALRALRQEGLDALFETYAAEIRQFSDSGEATDRWKRVAFAIDSVARQKDAYASRLYWHTDLQEAKRVANLRNKPILSLRLLGNLNEEFSCANSRFFRAILYPNAEISKFLRENYVLHWKSVRPAPKVTIDFGDGRKIERTLTGNSIHYILDEDGEIIDALPGLYSPKGFLKYLTQAAEVNKITDGLPREKKEMAYLRYRRAAFGEITSKREKAVAVAKVKLTETQNGTRAIEAAPLAVTKMAVSSEISILRGIADDFSRYEPNINFEDWRKLSKLYSPSPKLDANSTAFIRRQNAKTGLTETEFAALLQNLENFVALDTTRNDFLFHTKLYGWLNRGGSGDLETFNSRVYAEIFKTPESDKWLGLYNTDIYTALDGNGIIK
jgi:hypothetical protein